MMRNISANPYLSVTCTIQFDRTVPPVAAVMGNNSHSDVAHGDWSPSGVFEVFPPSSR